MAYWLSVAPDKVQTRRDSSRALAGPAPERQWKLPPSTCISLSVSTVYPHKLVRSVRGVQISLGWYSLCLPSCKHTPLLFTYLFFYYHNHTKMQMYLSTNLSETTTTWISGVLFWFCLRPCVLMRLLITDSFTSFFLPIFLTLTGNRGIERLRTSLCSFPRFIAAFCHTAVSENSDQHRLESISPGSQGRAEKSDMLYKRVGRSCLVKTPHLLTLFTSQ